MSESTRPLISVLIEGYNDSLDLGSAIETVQALTEQTYPLERVEIILTGNQQQASRWREALAQEHRFHGLKVIGVDAHYYQLKNLAAEASSGEILAFTDSDALADRNWLETIARGIEGGATAVAGLTQFRPEKGPARFPGLLNIAASISWGFIVPQPGEAARGFLSHNFGIRRSAFERIRYREDLGRTCAGSFLYQDLLRSGISVTFQPGQRVRHVFTWAWWVRRLHVRFGYEVYLLRRLNPSARYGWTQRLWLLEPAATMAWHVLLDVPQWFRFSQYLFSQQPGWSWLRRAAYVPAVLVVSLAARGAEAWGMYSTMLNPERMRRFALSN